MFATAPSLLALYSAVGLVAPRAAQQPTPAGASEPTSMFGAPVYVGATRIPDVEIQRYLCHGLGSKQVDLARFDVLIQIELERRRAAGEDLSKYQIDEATFARSLERQELDFKLKYPTLDYPTEVARALLSVDLYKRSARQAMLFDLLFFPENPTDWPELTRALVIEKGGESFLADAQQSYEARKKRQVEQGLPDIPPDDPIFTDTLRAWVLESLNNFSLQQTDPARLPQGVLLTVEQTPVTIDTVWQMVQPHVDANVLQDAKQFLVRMELARADLAQRGVLIPREKWEQDYAKDKPLVEALHNTQMLAQQIMGFPSMESFVQYAVLRDSYKQTIAADLASDEKLNAEIAPTNLIAGVGKVDCEVILCSAYDFDAARWKENGWELAKAHADEVKKLLDGGADWTQTIELHSQFWDPPMPEVGNKPQHGMYIKGKFGLKTRNELQQFMQENDFRSLLHGRTVTDRIFFDQAVGTIEGPVRGPRGYYISRVKGRTPITRPLDLAVPVHRQIAETYHVKNHFERYVWQLEAQARERGEIRGL